jgi:uracil-DNA glycosylase family 4
MEENQTKPIECRACPYFDRRRVTPDGSREAKVMLVGDYPSLTTPKQGQPFSDRKGIILKTALQHLRNMYVKAQDGHRRWQDLKQYRTYTVQCVSDDKPPKAPTTSCRRHLHKGLMEIRPKIIIVFGATAFNALGFGRMKFSDVRGTFQDYSFTRGDVTERFKVFVTFSLDAVLAQPGIYDDLVRDLRTAFLFAEGKQKAETTEEELIENYRFPQTVEEVEEVCDYIVNYAHEGADPDKHLIGADTETSALEMYDPDAKMIAASFAWEPGYATAFLVDHPEAPWTEEEKPRIHAAVRRVWECPKPKVLHHEKFDRQVVEGRYGWVLRNVVWDTMCGEHLIEEDKKGQYGLKVLTRTRLPKYAGYDDKVDEIRQEHGGLSRSAEAKRYVKAERKYEEAMAAYGPVKAAYDRAMVAYEKAVEVWNEKRLEEKALAKAEKRRMNKDNYGKKPPKPRKPKEPKAPVHLPPFDFTLIPVEDLIKYAAIDADVCRQHVLHQNKRLNLEHAQDVAKRAQMNAPAPPPVKRLMSQHVIPTSKTLAQMEFTGFPVDLDYLEKLDADLKGVADETQRQLYDMAGEFVINNPKEVIAVMFQRGFHDPDAGKRIIVPINDDLRRTKKGQIKADEKALLYVHKQYGYEFPKVLLTHRKANKARSPFLVNVREHAKLLDGRMHPTFHIPGTSTGRLSSSNENMQNFPKKLGGFNIKNIFVPPPGMVLVNTDAKGAEIRLFAAYSNDAKLIQAILDGLDTHSFFVSQVWKGIKYEDVERARELIDVWYDGDKSMGEEMFKWAEGLVRRRTNCKRVVFGTLYGAMAAKIAETAGIPLEEAQEVIDLMFEMFPTIPAYIQATQNEVLLYGGVYTKTGRKRRFPLANIRMFRNRCFRQAVNFKIQSTSSDMVLWVMNQVAPIITKDLQGELHATVHDSIVFSVPSRYLSQVPDMMYEHGTKRVAEKFSWLPIPFEWDVECGPSYGQVINIHKYLEGHDEHKIKAKEDGDIVEGDEIREEINAELRV